MSNISALRKRFEGSVETVPEAGPSQLPEQEVVNTSALKAKWETFVSERHKRQNSIVSNTSSVVSSASSEVSKPGKHRGHSKSLTEAPPSEEEKADGVLTKL